MFDAVVGPRDPYIRRFAYQSVAREWLRDEQWRRLRLCQRMPIPGKAVRVLQDPERLRAYYGGLISCGLTWACPVCAARLMDFRQLELEEAVAAHRERGGSLLFVTLTARHTARYELRRFLRTLSACVRETYMGGAFSRWRQVHGYLGSCKATEITHGDNGYHPHFHVLWFLGPGCTVDEVRSFVEPRWLEMLARAGLSGLEGIACKVLDATEDIATYMAKAGFHEDDWGGWDLPQELTRRHVKRAAYGSLSPTEMLLVGLVCRDDDPEAVREVQRLYVEYAESTRGLHSFRWSAGLRSRLGVGAVTDAGILEGAANTRALLVLGMLSYAQWCWVLGNDARGELLSRCAEGGAAALEEFLDLIQASRVA